MHRGCYRHSLAIWSFGISGQLSNTGFEGQKKKLIKKNGMQTLCWPTLQRTLIMMTVVEIPAFQTTASISDCFKLPPSLLWLLDWHVGVSTWVVSLVGAALCPPKCTARSCCHLGPSLHNILWSLQQGGKTDNAKLKVAGRLSDHCQSFPQVTCLPKWVQRQCIQNN